MMAKAGGSDGSSRYARESSGFYPAEFLFFQEIFKFRRDSITAPLFNTVFPKVAVEGFQVVGLQSVQPYMADCSIGHRGS